MVETKWEKQKKRDYLDFLPIDEIIVLIVGFFVFGFAVFQPYEIYFIIFVILWYWLKIRYYERKIIEKERDVYNVYYENCRPVPPDLLDKLKTKASYKSLIDSHKIRFSSLQYLIVKPIKVESVSDAEEALNIELDNYVLLSPDNIPLDEEDKEKLKGIIAKDPLSLIEYWSIDPNYDGITFRSQWQDYRENEDNDADPFHVVNKARLIVPKSSSRKVCVKAVDVFGFESIVIEKL